MSHGLNFKMSSSRRAHYVPKTKGAQSQVINVNNPNSSLAPVQVSVCLLLLFAVQRLKLLTLSNA